MAKKGCFVKLEYNSDRDSFILYSKYLNDQSWGVVTECKCVRRENAGAEEESNYVHFSILRKLADHIEHGFTLVQ